MKYRDLFYCFALVALGLLILLGLVGLSIWSLAFSAGAVISIIQHAFGLALELF